MTTETPTKESQPPPQVILDSKHLVPGEKVVWESRPAASLVFLKPIVLIVLALIFAYIILTYNGTLTYLIAALVVAGLMAPFDTRFGIPAAIAGVAIAFLVSLDRTLDVLVFIPVVLGVIPMIISYLQWRNTVFALTDRRIISQYGFLSRQYTDTGLDKVQNIALKQPLVERLFGFGDIAIVTSGEIGRPLRRRLGIRFASGGVIWENVPKPFEIEKLLSQYVYRPVATTKTAPG